MMIKPRDPKAGFDNWASAVDVVGRVAAAVGVMVVPGLVGQWLDHKWGTGFLALLGFLFGIPCGIYYLFEVVGFTPWPKPRSSKRSTSVESPPRDNAGNQSPQQRPPA